MKRTNPKFKQNDIVVFKKPDLYGCTHGTVICTEALYCELDNFGKLKRGGLTIMESSINDIQLPFTNTGEYLTIEYPENRFHKACKKIYAKCGNVVSVKSEQVCSVFHEKNLRRI